TRAASFVRVPAGNWRWWAGQRCSREYRWSGGKMSKAVPDPLFWCLSLAILAQILAFRVRRQLGRAGRVALVVAAIGTAGLWLLSTHAAESYLIGRLSAVHPVPAAEDVARVDVGVVLSGGVAE